ncbi:MAG: LCP family protein [Clostridia bacterium]|nr:LCP family protein [Clostridia bacterium]
MKPIFKIIIAALVVLGVAALGVFTVFFADTMRLRLILCICAALLVLVGLILGIVLSKPRWLKILYGCVLFVLVAAAGTAYFVGADFMSSLNEGSVEITERLSPAATAAPMPELEYTDEAPAEEEFDIDIDTDTDTEVEATLSPEATPVPIYKRDRLSEDVVNILILGQDADRLYSGYGRSDVMLLISYDRTKGTIKLLSFMRDSYVPIEGHNWNRLNTCIRFGGPGLIINTINELFDLDIQYYVTLAFDEFKTLVDNIGGIDVELNQKEANRIGVRWAGEGETHHLNGTQALIFVRDRKTGQGDFSRTEHQRRFMLALYDKIRSEMNFNTLTSLVNFSKGYVRTNLSFADITALGLELLDGPAIEIETARMPFDGTWRYARVNGASVLPIDIEANAELIHEYLYGE